jgi:hypothetical protein
VCEGSSTNTLGCHNLPVHVRKNTCKLCVAGGSGLGVNFHNRQLGLQWLYTDSTATDGCPHLRTASCRVLLALRVEAVLALTGRMPCMTLMMTNWHCMSLWGAWDLVGWQKNHSWWTWKQVNANEANGFGLSSRPASLLLFETSISSFVGVFLSLVYVLIIIFEWVLIKICNPMTIYILSVLSVSVG